MTKVLILASTEDAHATEVAKHLTEMQAEVDYFRYEEFIQQCRMTYTLGRKNRVCLIERADGSKLDLDTYSGIWHRRPGSLVAGEFPEAWIQRMVELESRYALEGMFHSLKCVWMNYPPNDYKCLQKLRQLEVAAEVGLAIPETLVTNKPALVEQFFEECGGQVIYKMIGEGTNFSIPAYENPRGVSTLPLRKEDLPFIDQVKHSAHLFQRCIPKSFELRVTVVGKKIFCINIDSQSGKGKIDWRHDYSVDMDPFELPADISDKCLALMRRFGLNYGAIDFIVTDDGKYVFLEINCAGQYMWIEKKTDLPISLEIARLLTGKSEPLCTIN